MAPEPKSFIPKILPYPPGKPIEEVRREYGLDSVIKLASNENPLGPSPKAVEAMQAAAGEMHLYPDGNGFYLREALSKKLKVPAARICLGNGSDEITDLIAMAYLRQADNIVVSRHDFVSYRLAAMMVGAKVREVPLTKDWRADMRGLAGAIDEHTRLVCIANPSNPIGTMVRRGELETFLKKVPERVMVLLDEAYFEYVTDPEYPSGADYLKDYPNLVVTRTFSKAYGLAGLRIGYALASEDIIQNFNRVRPPFNTNRIGQAAALAALDDRDHIKRSIATNRKGRKVLEKAFEKLGLDFIPSQTNFVLVDLGRPAAPVVEGLLRLGVIIRPMGGYGLPNHIRITIGLEDENQRLIAAMKSVLSA